MSAQTAYTKVIAQAIAGLLAYVGSPADVVSRIAEGVVGFGVAVGRGTDTDDQVVVGLGAGFLGIAVRDTAIENSPVGGEIVSYPDEKNVAIMRQGYIWGKLAAAMTPAIGGDVWFNDTTGEFGTTVTAGFSKIDGATYESVATGGLAIIRIGVSGTTAGA